MNILRVAIVGSVDDGKSTLIGRLLFDSGNIFEDQIAQVQRSSQNEGLQLAWFTDGLKHERQNGITMDVAYRYFNGSNHRFILADCPGHFELTHNMITGAAQSDLAIILMDASLGVQPQTKRHAYLTSLLEIPHLVVCINKMDLLNHEEATLQKWVEKFSELTNQLNIPKVSFIPTSALHGDNIATISNKMPWYHGPSLFNLLDSCKLANFNDSRSFRLVVQTQLSPTHFAGRVSIGTIRAGEEIEILSLKTRARVSNLFIGKKSVASAMAGQSISFTLDQSYPLTRGTMITHPQSRLSGKTEIQSTLTWLSPTPMAPKDQFLMLHNHKVSKVKIKDVSERFNFDSFSKEKVDFLTQNETGIVRIESNESLYLDKYSECKETGSFVLVDPRSHQTLALGLNTSEI